MMKEMAKLVEDLYSELGKAVEQACAAGRKLRGHAVVAQRRLSQLQQTMTKLLPQIRHWLRTGRVLPCRFRNPLRKLQSSNVLGGRLLEHRTV